MEKTLPIRSIRRSPSAGMSHLNRPDKANFEDRDLDVRRNTVNASIRTYALSGIMQFLRHHWTPTSSHQAGRSARKSRRERYHSPCFRLTSSSATRKSWRRKPLKLRCSRVSSRWTYLLKQTIFENPRWYRVCPNEGYGDHCRSPVRTG